MPRMRLWDSLLLTYCRQRPCDQHRGLLVFTGFAGKQRADERTRTAYSCSLRVIIHVLQGLAEGYQQRQSSFTILLPHASAVCPAPHRHPSKNLRSVAPLGGCLRWATTPLSAWTSHWASRATLLLPLASLRR